MKPAKIRTAFILGAGLGMRLRPLTERCPKPLLPVGGRPLITYAMDHCLSIGVSRFIVNTHHCAPAYDEAFPEKSWRKASIIFHHEPILLDTAGGIKNIETLLTEEDANFLVYNGDILSDIPLSRLLAAHAAAGCEVTLALRSDGPLRNVCLDANSEICDFRDLLGNPGVRRCLFTGISTVARRFLRHLTPGKIESTIPVFVEMVREAPGSVASVVIDEGIWEDIGDLPAYERIQAGGPTLRYEVTDGGATAIPGVDREDPTNVTNALPSTLPTDFPALAGGKEAAFIHQTLSLEAGTQIEMSPVGKGGSDRSYFRVSAAGGRSAVLMRYGRMYEENDLYVAVASFLQEIGVTVPAIYGHDPERRLILMEDLGDRDLYALRDAPWDIRRGLYEKTLSLAAKMPASIAPASEHVKFCHAGLDPASSAILDSRFRGNDGFDVYCYRSNNLEHLPTELRLMPGFDAELYRWERNYFREECVRNACRITPGTAEDEALEEELSALADRLLATPPVLVHRDLQSQNVMIRNGEPVLIDFQGLRTGSPFYDIASLLYDPYVSFPEGGRDELLQHYHRISGTRYDWNTFRELFLLASAQRLMQALGAYGFLGLKREKPHFLNHIRPALKNLIAVTAEAGSLPRLNALARRCREALKGG